MGMKEEELGCERMKGEKQGNSNGWRKARREAVRG